MVHLEERNIINCYFKHWPFSSSVPFYKFNTFFFMLTRWSYSVAFCHRWLIVMSTSMQQELKVDVLQFLSLTLLSCHSNLPLGSLCTSVISAMEFMLMYSTSLGPGPPFSWTTNPKHFKLHMSKITLIIHSAPLSWLIYLYSLFLHLLGHQNLETTETSLTFYLGPLFPHIWS